MTKSTETRPFSRCPATPNCVCSDDLDRLHGIPAIRVEGSPEIAFAEARRIIEAWPRTRIVRLGEGHLRAECRSAWLRFVDDLELELRPDDTMAVRSASRVGFSDLGVNRRRVERLRAALAQAGVARS